MLKLLIVEDVEDHARLLEAQLRRALEGDVEFAHAGSVAQAEQCLDPTFDAVLLDLRLPDGDGFDTVRRVREAAPEVAIVVVSGSDDPELVVDVLRAGAEDHLPKGVGAGVLVDRIQRAIARHRHLVEQLEAARRAEREQTLLARLERLSGDGVTTQVTARRVGDLRLSEGHPDVFESGVARYLELLDVALRDHVYGREDGHEVSTGLRELARDLAAHLVGPRDVVDIHTTALRRVSGEVAPERLEFYLDEGRTVLLELMGDLVAHYRWHMAADALIATGSR